jgi:hypothetical protein
MNRCPSLRRYVIRELPRFVQCSDVQRSVAFCLALTLSACLPFSSGHSSPLSGYRVLVEARDSASEYLAQALARKGFTVRRRVRGGSPPTAALITFTFPAEPPSREIWYAVRLADTRSGAVVAAVSAPLALLAPSPAERAQQLADSLVARLSTP